MGLKERIYSVLIVSSAEKLNTALVSMLPENRYEPIMFASNISAAKRLYADRSFDFVIINSPMPDGDGSRFAIDISSNPATVVLLLIRAEQYNDLYEKVSGCGVFTL
ncbi:MAG: antitermination regulator, partial [Eggerthellaceae bacterium]|nr:antitermination regulator [Eggerthellaceae bacterium]